jgi:homeobox protein cut-like
MKWLGTADVESHASHLGQAAVAAAGPLVNAAGGDSQHGDWHEEGFSENVS